MNFRFIKSFCQIQLDLCGMSCIYPARNKLGQVWELWPLNMNDFMDVEISDGVINPSVNYLFRMNGKDVSFNKKELVVLHYPNPICSFRPMSPIQAQAYAVDIDAYVEIYERDFFKNSARIDMALSTDEDMNQEKSR